MERKTKLEVEEFYHIYNRGVEKRKIFQVYSDYKRFLALLYIANNDQPLHIKDFGYMSLEEIFKQDRGEQLVAIGAYCLMPNHFHLLLTPLVDGGISKFMLKLQTGYSMYFNKKNDRVGPLFQGTFKSKHATDDLYLKYIYAYIHLNPAKLKNPNWKTQSRSFLTELEKFVAEYPYSSLQEYISLNYKIINPAPFPVEGKDIIDYDTIINDFSEFPEDNPREI
ncbi:MAG: transposase [Burkholderiales bacterium]|nr:transposase [Burkholderiales bacterium]